MWPLSFACFEDRRGRINRRKALTLSFACFEAGCYRRWPPPLLLVLLVLKPVRWSFILALSTLSFACFEVKKYNCQGEGGAYS